MNLGPEPQELPVKVPKEEMWAVASGREQPLEVSIRAATWLGTDLHHLPVALWPWASHLPSPLGTSVSDVLANTMIFASLLQGWERTNETMDKKGLVDHRFYR